MRLANGITSDRPSRVLTYARLDALARDGLPRRLLPLFRRPRAGQDAVAARRIGQAARPV